MPRRPFAIALAALAAAAGACTDAVPCSACPSLAGHYELAFEEQSRSPDCAVLPSPAQPSAVDLAQVGSTCRTTVAGLDLVGTVFDSWDFVLNGTASPDGGTGSQSISVRGRFVPPPSGQDGGSSIQGTWTSAARQEVAGAARNCSVELKFTGNRR